MFGQPGSAERLGRSAVPVIAGTRNAEVTAGFAKTNQSAIFPDLYDYLVSGVPSLLKGLPIKLATFF